MKSIKNILIILMYILIIFNLVILISSINIRNSFAKYKIEDEINIGKLSIDRTPPTINITYSNIELTNKPVIVKIESNEEINKIEGWNIKKDNKTLEKLYKKNTNEQIIIEDISGNIVKKDIKINNIDLDAPKVSIKEIKNSNEKYNLYANKNTEISVILNIIDNYEIVETLKKEDLIVNVNNKQVMCKIEDLEYIKNNIKEKEVLLKISNIEEEGKLQIVIPKNIVKDKAGNTNEEGIYNTNINVDNIKPEGNYTQTKIEDGKIKAKIVSNEEIRNIEGWETKDNKIFTKEFPNSISYELEIVDYAGNTNMVSIDIINATNISLTYASHNSIIGWTYGYGNYDIAGLNAIKVNPIYKTESLAFNISGDIDKDFLQVRSYIYTYWGEGSKAKCLNTKKIYSYGYNPSINIWKSMTSENTVRLNDKDFMQLGGAGVNGNKSTDINGNNPISLEIGEKYMYGISSIQLKLKDYSKYSILYQTYVKEVGWLKTAMNEEEACYKKDKPMSAIRVALVPNSEIKSVKNMWDKDIGKFVQ